MSALEIDNKAPLPVGEHPPRFVKDIMAVDQRSHDRMDERAAIRQANKDAQATRRQRLGKLVASGATAVALVSPAGQEQVVQPVADKVVDVGNIGADIAGDVKDGVVHTVKVITGYENQEPTIHDGDGIPG